MDKQIKISIVTPTLRRHIEVKDLLENVSGQTLIPSELILVDGAPVGENKTEELIIRVIDDYPFKINYIRRSGGTAIQRNIGIDAANGDFIALVDDDVRLKPDFLENIINAFSADNNSQIGGIVGYRVNRHFEIADSERWRWYKRLKLLTTYEPGRYDFDCGYPINNNMQPPFQGMRAVDFMTTACAVWRREVFDSGLRFHPFFRDYGVLEDAHFSLMAGKSWKLMQCGDAHCEELHSPNGRVSPRKIGYKCVVNYYFVFNQIVSPLSWLHKIRFWRYQLFELFRIGSSFVRRRKAADFYEILGRIEGFGSVFSGRAYKNETFSEKHLNNNETRSIFS